MTARVRSFLPRSRSKLVFVLAISAYSTAINYFMVALRDAVQVQWPSAGLFTAPEQQPIYHLLELLLFAPVVESLILVAVLELARRTRAAASVQIIAAAVTVSSLHAWPWWPHAVIVLPAFCIDAASYLYWRSRDSFKVSFVVVVSIHALSNSISAIYTVGHVFQKA